MSRFPNIENLILFMITGETVIRFVLKKKLLIAQEFSVGILNAKLIVLMKSVL
jgi:hypothetical protein